MEQPDDCLREVEEALQFPEEENDTIEEENHSARRFNDKIAIIETENRINRLREATVTRRAGKIPIQAGLMMEGAGREQVATSPCAACKLLRRRCTQDCVFPPSFPVEEPQKFANVHKVFGASNVNKMLQENRENVLPLSWKDLTNTPLEGSTLDSKAFLCFIRRSVLNIPPKYHGALLLLCGGFLSYQAKNMTTPFDFPFEESTNTPQSLLSFGEACDAFSPEMAYITKFILCYFLTLTLVWQLHPGVQIFCMLLLISAPLFYFPELVSKASRIDVACGSFKLPLIWFTTLGALGLSLICGLLTLLMVYFSWRFIYKGTPRAEEIKVSLDALSEILDGVN